MNDEEKSRLKSEIRMLVWYLSTEPARKVRYLFQVVGKTINTNLLLYVMAVFAIILFIRDWKDITWVLIVLIIILLGIYNIWRRKRFIHVYRKEKYKIE